MALKTLSAKNAAALDKDLMSFGAFSIDQLMELAGLSVSQAAGAAGSWLLAVQETMAVMAWYEVLFMAPQGPMRLATQLRNLGVPFVDDFDSAITEADHVVDAIFGFSFSGEVREPFPAVIKALKETELPVTSIDAPSSWSIENGPPDSGPGNGFHPSTLVSLTAPKPLVKWFTGRHFIGGRFVSPDIAKKYNLELPAYEGIDQVVEVENIAGKL
ncbi:NAD(P)H-hydrate epimerase [Coleophoma crateriformis]|uniref:NAD(P)H-hydrate epimerase n=1 Tax=Coleophoma crateriformis TaxID=565419 RepID=A0A3D8QYN4_9HELO|nr:NAD(P)H-hydrate epimerase [Coleophoma crateriformis]